MSLTRRRFLTASAAVLPSVARSQANSAFSFALLGDLHYDKLEHHDMAWLDKHHAGDLGQIKNYSRITADITPRLFDAVRQSVSASGADFVLQVGDLVEGLCGNEDLSLRQNREALDFITNARLGVPFLFTKGNHDVTGDGAPEAFKEAFHAFIDSQTRGFTNSGPLVRAAYSIEHRDALFCFYDAYDAASLDWLEATLAKRTARHCFVVIHPPVVPYGARSTWHLFASSKDKAKRQKLLTMLGQHHAFVLGGHIHRFNTISRVTPGGGRFVQFALSSIVNTTNPKASTELEDLESYTPEQVRVEPKHSPETEQERRAVYVAEMPLVRAFAYADLPGHAVVRIEGDQVEARMYSGVSQQLYRNVSLSKLMTA